MGYSATTIARRDRDTSEWQAELSDTTRSVSGTCGMRSAIGGALSRERNHQGLGNELIDGVASHSGAAVRRRQRLGGLFSYYHRAA